MAGAIHEKFSSHAAPDVLAALRKIAKAEGRQFHVVLEEALRDYIERHRKEMSRRLAMASSASSRDDYDKLYRELAR